MTPEKAAVKAVYSIQTRNIGGAPNKANYNSTKFNVNDCARLNLLLSGIMPISSAEHRKEKYYNAFPSVEVKGGAKSKICPSLKFLCIIV